jgi:hypothetical protein
MAFKLLFLNQSRDFISIPLRFSSNALCGQTPSALGVLCFQTAAPDFFKKEPRLVPLKCWIARAVSPYNVFKSKDLFTVSCIVYVIQPFNIKRGCTRFLGPRFDPLVLHLLLLPCIPLLTIEFILQVFTMLHTVIQVRG